MQCQPTSHLCSGADAYEVAYSKICIQHVIVGLDIQAIITGVGLWRGPWDQAGVIEPSSYSDQLCSPWQRRQESGCKGFGIVKVGEDG